MFSVLRHVEISLKKLNTFGLNVKADELLTIRKKEDLILFLEQRDKSKPYLILGGGSNVLFTSDYSGTILLNRVTGITFKQIDNDKVLLTSGSGEVWHDLVIRTIDEGLCGLENLSLIPGTVGAAPIQNIGAYGVEIKDTFHSLEAIHLKDGSLKTFSKEECGFGYRDSVFKSTLKGQYFILSVTFCLSKIPHLNTSYGAISTVLRDKGITTPTLRDVSNAVIEIRRSKLPDPAEIGNSGSFFKNPVINNTLFESLKATFPEIPSYPDSKGVKVPAGWLIEQCGWKGYRDGDIGVHKNQALVLVNYGSGKGEELWKLAEKIMESVYKTFQIKLEPEVNII